MIITDYESEASLAQYLLFHYGPTELNCPWAEGPGGAVGYPQKVVDLMLEGISCQAGDSALDVGCAVGGSTFALAGQGYSAEGIDLSSRFIEAARSLAGGKSIPCAVPSEGEFRETFLARAPAHPGKVSFALGDAGALPYPDQTYAVVLLVNLIDRVPDPAVAVREAARVLKPGGSLIIASPYTWTEDCAPADKWLNSGHGSSMEGIQNCLGADFSCDKRLDIPFLIREHRRKFQWSMAEASRWRSPSRA